MNYGYVYFITAKVRHHIFFKKEYAGAGASPKEALNAVLAKIPQGMEKKAIFTEYLHPADGNGCVKFNRSRLHKHRTLNYIEIVEQSKKWD